MTTGDLLIGAESIQATFIVSLEARAKNLKRSLVCLASVL